MRSFQLPTLPRVLDHPDDGGDDFSPAECASILVRLEAVTGVPLVFL
ncbi:hypothetical protein ACFWGI_30680 [Streptomyces niveus]